MASSSQAQILPGQTNRPYTATGSIGFGCAVGYPDQDGIVAVTTTGPFLGVAANAVSDGEICFVAVAGPCYVKIGGTVTWATSPYLQPTTDGEFVEALAAANSQVRAIADARQGDGAVDGDVIQALLGVGAFHS
jgi:hypothetical protein